MKLAINIALIFTYCIGRDVSAFTTNINTNRKSSIYVGKSIGSSSNLAASAKAGQAEVVLVGCGAPNRGMGWYHAVQMLEGR